MNAFTLHLKKKIIGIVSILLLWHALSIHAQKATSITLNNTVLVPYGVTVKNTTYKGKQAVELIQTKDTDQVYTFASLKNVDFHNGTIELFVSGEPKKDASTTARGFVGISFRMSADTSRSETFYIRPSNGRAAEQERRNHSLQYISHPGYPWQLLRKNTPERYESYTDLVPGEWTKLKIEVQGEIAKLYVNGALQPNLIVTDLKQGKNHTGTIALWIAIGTHAYFADLTITKTD